jgi:hypothetical protein
VDLPKNKGGNELDTFTSELTSMDTSSSKEWLKSIKVDERKCKDDIGISSLSSASYFTMKVGGPTFTIDSTVHGVRIVP